MSGEFSARSGVGSGSPQAQHSSREVAQAPAASGRPRVSFAPSVAPEVCAQDLEDGEEDKRESVVDSSVIDKTYNRLIQYVYDQYDESRPLSDPSAPPCCEFESYFSVAEPQSLARPRMLLYPRVVELVTQSRDRATKFARESKPLHKVIPLRWRLFPVADNLDFAAPRWLNPDFVRLTGNKNIAKTRVGAVTFSDLEKVEKCPRTLVGGQSQSFWLLSALLSQLKQNGFKPSDLSLLDKTILALFASLATQTVLSSGFTDFVVAKRRESFLGHVSFPMSEPQKCELFVSPGSDAWLFDPPLLEKVSGQLKEDSLISSLSLSKLSKSADCFKSVGGCVQGSSQRYSSPLDFSRPGPSGYGKRSASPTRGNSSKRGHGGRGMSPSKSCKGFRK